MNVLSFKILLTNHHLGTVSSIIVNYERWYHQLHFLYAFLWCVITRECGISQITVWIWCLNFLHLIQNNESLQKTLSNIHIFKRILPWKWCFGELIIHRNQRRCLYLMNVLTNGDYNSHFLFVLIHFSNRDPYASLPFWVPSFLPIFCWNSVWTSVVAQFISYL